MLQFPANDTNIFPLSLGQHVTSYCIGTAVLYVVSIVRIATGVKQLCRVYIILHFFQAISQY